MKGGKVAKKVIFEDEEALKSIEELKEDEIEELFNHVPVQVEEIITINPMVDVIPLRDFSCSYAGNWYYFTKGKRQKIPMAMREFLLRNKNQPKIKD